MVNRGLFIVLEGLDRSGKSTQVSRLHDQLEQDGHKARIQKFPDRITAIGKMIDSYLRSEAELDDRAVHLLFSANRWECCQAIEQSLQDGVTVIADRYAFSGIAFSAAKGLPFDFCASPDIGLPLPDVTLYLTVSPAAAAKRAAYGTERYEQVDLQNRVREQFKLVADKVRTMHGPDRWVEVDAEGSIDQVWERIWSQVKAIESKKGEQIHRLWT
ncbi:thymidylate kinase-domain-containing protein [Kockovaella imperatae]|uniref:Thymidylate kinase n=1 Tax=Kockovaella imperatae TaxID=4999 RepID=A0A1Y1UCI7_9TREE|nr:thymidylate kinase-domain-containing protein [Kockovaella imperatae]ORX35760.1 thymidylate kinase-domain-containing protein [Kockovaella imperatae]